MQKPWVRAATGLRPFLCRDYLQFSADGGGQSWVQPAEASATLLIEVKEPVRVRGTPLPRVWVSGPFTEPDTVELGQAHDLLDIKLTPLGAYSLIGWPLRQLAGEIVGLDDLFGRIGADLADRLLEAQSLERRVEILEDFLLRRAAQRKVPDRRGLRLAAFGCDRRPGSDREGGRRARDEPPPSHGQLPRAGGSIAEEDGEAPALRSRAGGNTQRACALG